MLRTERFLMGILFLIILVMHGQMPEANANGDWIDDFENYTVGEFPSPSWTNSGNNDAFVDSSKSVSGDNSLKLFGLLNSCWGALAHRSIVVSSPWTMEFYVYNGSETLTGCHPFYGAIELHTGATWTSSNRPLLLFDYDGAKNTIKGIPDNVDYANLGTFLNETWYKVKIAYNIVDAATVRISYWINGQLKGSYERPSYPYESDLSYLSLEAGEGSAWFDDVKIISGEPRPTTTGVFRPTDGLVYLKKENTTGFADASLCYGIAGDIPVAGDWDGDGVDGIGVYRNGQFYLKNTIETGYADMVFAFGQDGDQPVAGDWNGDGIDTIGVYRDGLFMLRNANSTGPPDVIFALGTPGDTPLAGDWNGDGHDSCGVFRPDNGLIFLKNENTSGYADVAITFGIENDLPVMGDWDGDGVDTIGVYRDGAFLLRNSNETGWAEMMFWLGVDGDVPISGKWGLP